MNTTKEEIHSSDIDVNIVYIIVLFMILDLYVVILCRFHIINYI